MSFADFVRPALTSFVWVCYIVLGFYLARVLAFIVRGGDGTTTDSHRLREAMAMAYTIVAAIYIGASVDAIVPFTQRILEAVDSLRTPPSWMGSVLVLCAASVCAAFICNFSRSLWMLKSLDHGVFEAVPEWAGLSAASSLKRWAEFLLRTVAALLFIRLELEFKTLATSSLKAGVQSAVLGSPSPSYLDQAGFLGMFLYLSLAVWWIVGCSIAKARMPKGLLAFYLMGFVNSLFLWLYGRKTVSPDEAMLLLLIMGLAACCALYMLWVVVRDVLVVLRDLARNKPSRLRMAS